MPISITGVSVPFARWYERMYPQLMLKLCGVSGPALRAYEATLQREAGIIEGTTNRHVKWEAIQRVTAILDRLDIPHPGTDVWPDDWRAFLAHMIAAANEGNIKRARGVMSDEELGFERARSGFNAPGSAPFKDDEA